jgi:hypothetical protein
MNLDITDRVVLLNILPKEGSVVVLRLIRDLQRELGFSEEEIAEIGFSDGDRGLRWEKNIEKDVEIGPEAQKIIVAAFKRLDDAGKLIMDMLPVYEKFVDSGSE